MLDTQTFYGMIVYSLNAKTAAKYYCTTADEKLAY